jgi:hypothetical protein
MQISWTIFSIVSGGMYFQEFQEYDAFSLSMFLLGVAVITVGVFYLTPSPPTTAKNYSDLVDNDSARNLTMDIPRGGESGDDETGDPQGTGGSGCVQRPSSRSDEVDHCTVVELATTTDRSRQLQEPQRPSGLGSQLKPVSLPL